MHTVSDTTAICLKCDHNVSVTILRPLQYTGSSRLQAQSRHQPVEALGLAGAPAPAGAAADAVAGVVASMPLCSRKPIAAANKLTNSYVCTYIYIYMYTCVYMCVYVYSLYTFLPVHLFTYKYI